MPNKSETPANAEDVGQPKTLRALAAPNGHDAWTTRPTEDGKYLHRRTPEDVESEDDFDVINGMTHKNGTPWLVGGGVWKRHTDQAHPTAAGGTGGAQKGL